MIKIPIKKNQFLIWEIIFIFAKNKLDKKIKAKIKELL